MANHIDVPYAVIRAAKQAARNTGTKVVRLRLDDDGNPDSHVTLRNGRGENKGSFTVAADGSFTVHKKLAKKPRKQAADATPEATDGE
jgi:hypothetical protein